MPNADSLLPETPFYNPRLSRVGLEVMSLAEMRAKDRAYRLIGTPHRIDFLMVLLVTAGTGEHVLDFQTLSLAAGIAVVARPGEVQQWRLREGLEGDLVMVDPAVIRPASTAFSGAAFRLLRIDAWPSAFRLSSEDQADWRGLAALLRKELAGPALDDLAIALAHELFLCLLLRTARSAQEERGLESAHTLLHRRLLRNLERVVAQRPSVEELARELGVSASTLGRACRASTGRSAKWVIDRRVALEAKRLLVHSSATAAAIGEQLGFSEPTNFLKFFKRQAGMTPDGFRRLHR